MNCEECKFSYACCKNYYVTIHPNEANKYKYKRLRRIYEKGKFIGYAWTLTCQENGYCMYFDYENKKCRIHENKPEVCKNWKECELWQI